MIFGNFDNLKKMLFAGSSKRLLTVLIVLLLSIANCANIYVSPTGNDSTGDGSLANPYQTPQKGLNQVTANNTVYLFPGDYTLGSSGNITWPSVNNVTLTGYTAGGATSVNVILDGQGVTRCINISNTLNLSISNLTIANGSVTNNTGGGVLFTVKVATLNLTNVIATGNKANGINACGGVIYCLNDTIMIFVNNSIFSQNSSSQNSSFGGGVAYNGTFTVSNSIFSGNFSNSYGGVAEGGVWKVNNSTFSGNHGAAGVAEGGTWTVNNSIFNGNFSNELGSVSDGGLWTVSNSIFNGNFSYEGGVESYGAWTVNNSIFSGNSSQYGSVGYSDSWVVNNSTFSGNYSGISGGVAYGSTWTVTNSIFWNNKENGIVQNEFNSSYITLNYCSVSTVNFRTGGTVATRNLYIGNPIFASEVSANPMYLQLYGTSPVINFGTSNISVTTDIRGVSRNIYGAYDLGAYEYNEVYLSDFSPGKSSTSSAVNADIIFRVRDNTHPSKNIQVSITVNGVDYTVYTIATNNNTAISTDMYVRFDVADFNEIYTNYVTINASCPSSSVQDNYSFKPLSLGIFVSPTGNDTTGDGSFFNPYQTPRKAMNVVTTNGFVYLFPGTYPLGSSGNITWPSVNNVTLTGYAYSGANSTNVILDGQGVTRCIFVSANLNVTMNISNLTIANGGVTDDQGAAILIKTSYATLKLNNFIATNNHTNGTSSLYAYGGVIYCPNNLLNIFANNSIFSQNSAYAAGGVGAYGNWTVNNCIFNGNSNPNNQYGGGVAYQGIWTVNNCIFSGNSGKGYGGVAYYGTWIVNNSIFNGNSSSYVGGVAYYGTWIVNNSTFVNNTSISGGNVVAYSGAWVATNSIFWNNNEGGIFRRDFITSSITLNYCSVTNKDYQEANTAFYANNLFYGDPKFVSVVSTNNQYLQLAWNSPLIDVGTSNVPVTTDILGVARSRYSGYDLGAYEYNGSILLSNFTPAKYSKNVSPNTNISFRIRDTIDAKANTNVSITVNGVDYTAYTVATDNSSATTTDRYVVFAINPLPTANTIFVTVNFSCPSGNFQDNYWFITSRNNMAFNISHGATINYQYIQDALNAASVNDTIIVTAGVWDEGDQLIWPNVSGITLRGQNSANSANVVISGGGQHRVIRVDYPVIMSLANLTIANGNVTNNNNGAGILLNMMPATLNLTNVIVTGNNANGSTAPLYANGGAIYCLSYGYNGQIFTNNSIFSQNSAYGGGVVYFGNGGNWTINNCTFSNNSAGNGGGGVESGGTWTIVNNSIFTGNTGGNYGGVAAAGTWTVNNSIFSNNSANYGGVAYSYSNWAVNNSTFSNNSAQYYGGVAYSNCSWTVTNSIFWNNKENNIIQNDFNYYNKVTLNYCSVSTVNYQANGTVATSNLYIGNPVFASEVSTDAKYLQFYGTSPLINYGTSNVSVTTDIRGVSRNIYGAPDLGAYEYNEIYLSNFMPTKNTAGNSPTLDVVLRVRDFSHPSKNISISITLNGVSYSAFAIGANTNTAVSTDMYVSFNVPDFTASATNNVSVNAVCPSSSVQDAYWFKTLALVNFVSVTGNDSTGDGTLGNPYQTPQKALNTVLPNGTVYLMPGTYTLGSSGNITWPNINGLTLAGYTTGGGTSANVILDGQGVTRCIYDLNIVSFNLRDLSIVNGYVSGNGGAFLFDTGAGSTLNLSNVIVSNNISTGSVANTYGGAIYFTSATASVVINNCIFDRNAAKSAGGVVYSGGYSRADNSIFKNSFTNNYGGVFYFGYWLVNNCIFDNNSSFSSSNGGGGVGYSMLGPSTLNNCVFVNNNARGGAVFSSGSLKIKNSIFWNNYENGVSKNDLTSVTGTLDNCSVGTANYRSGGTLTTTNIYIGDPKFVSGVSTNPKYLQLSAYSPLINYGTSNVSVSTDIRGVSRNIYGAYDVGAYEYDDLYLSDYLPTKSATSQLTTADIIIRVRDNNHISKNIQVSITVNGVDYTTYTIATNNNTAVSTDMYLRFDVADFVGLSTPNVTINSSCPSVSYQDNYWFSVTGNVNVSSIYISPTGSDIVGLGDGTALYPYQTIQKGFSVVTPGATIYLYPGTYPLGSVGTIVWPFKNNITLIGYTSGGGTSANVIIDGQGVTRCISITNNMNVNIKNLTLANGYSNLVSGGGIYSSSGGLISLNNVIMTGNIASGGVNGGAVYAGVGGSTIRVNNSLFSRNRSSIGGAISAALISVNNTIFNENVASFNGAIDSNGASGNNCIFINNRADNTGGVMGLSLYANPYIFYNSTFFNNSATTGSVVYNTTFKAVNCIFWNNKTNGVAKNDFYNVTLNLTYSSVGTVNYQAACPSIVTSNLYIGNPVFASEVQTDPKYLQLSAISPVINVGTSNVPVNVDIRGVPRGIYGAYDLGAYEYNEGVYLSDFTPQKSSIGNTTTADIVFRVRDNNHPSQNLQISITVNGTDYTAYTMPTNNNTAVSTDMYVRFDVADFTEASTVSVTLNASCPSSSVQDSYWFIVTGNYLSPIIYVAPTGDDTAGNGTLLNPYQTPQKGLNMLGANGTVYLLPGTYPLGSSGNITWPNKNNLTLAGYTAGGGTSTNVILDGQGVTRCIYQAINVDFTIKDLSVVNGFVSGGIGSGIFVYAYNSCTLNNLIISGNIITGNSGTMYGGAVGFWNSGVTYNIKNCWFKNNISNYRAAAFNPNYSTGLIEDCVFENNSAYQGAAIYYPAGTINRTLFIGNSTSQLGGLFYGCGNLIINDSRFVSNNAAGGGAILYSGTSTPVTFNNCLFIGNTGLRYSCFYLVNISVCNSTFYNNSNPYTSYSPAIARYSTINVVNTVFWKNLSNGIYGPEFGDNYSLNLSNSSVQSELFNVSGPVSVNNLYIGDPKFVSEVSANANFLKLSWNSPLVNYGTSNVSVTRDILGTPRGVFGGYDAGAYEYNDAVLISDKNPDNNSKKIPVNTNIVFRIRDSEHPSASIGLSITVNGTGYTIYSIVSDNSTTTADFYAVFDINDLSKGATNYITVNFSCPGGARQDAYSFTSEKDPAAFNISHGPAINYQYIQEALNAASVNDTIVVTRGICDEGQQIVWPNINGLTLKGIDGATSADVVISGGNSHRVIYINNPVALNISNLTMANGGLTDIPGAGINIAIANVTLNLSNVIMTGNNALNLSGQGNGGVISLYSATFTAMPIVNIDNCLFSGNSAYRGGALHATSGGTFYVTNSRFSNNHSIYMGAVFNYGYKIIVSNCDFDNNYSDSYAGVVYAPDFTAYNSRFTGNAGWSGIAYLTTGKMYNCVFTNNNGRSTAGVFYDSSIQLYNSVFADNYASAGGIARLLSSTSINAYNCTFIRNKTTSTGGGAIAYGSPGNYGNLNAVNCVFWKNTVNNVTSNEFLTLNVRLDYCSFSTINYTKDCTVTNSNIYIGDPLFASEVSSNPKYLQLSYSSPLINYGTSNISVTTDITGQPRGIYGAYDLGAYEYNELYLSGYSPAKNSTGNMVTADIVFRVRDNNHPSQNLQISITVNGTDYSAYTMPTNNNTAVSTDMYVRFDVADFASQSTPNVTINVSCPSSSVQDTYWFAVKNTFSGFQIVNIFPTSNESVDVSHNFTFLLTHQSDPIDLNTIIVTLNSKSYKNGDSSFIALGSSTNGYEIIISDNFTIGTINVAIAAATAGSTPYYLEPTTFSYTVKKYFTKDVVIAVDGSLTDWTVHKHLNFDQDETNITDNINILEDEIINDNTTVYYKIQLKDNVFKDSWADLQLWFDSRPGTGNADVGWYWAWPWSPDYYVHLGGGGGGNVWQVEYQYWNGAAWTDGGNSGIQYAISGNYLEVGIPRSKLGNATAFTYGIRSSKGSDYDLNNNLNESASYYQYLDSLKPIVNLSRGVYNGTPQTILNTQTQALGLQFAVTNEEVTLNTLTLKQLGTESAGKLQAYIYQDNDQNGYLSYGDTLLGSGVFNNTDQAVTISGLNCLLGQTQTTNILVGLLVSDNVAGSTLQVQVTSFNILPGPVSLEQAVVNVNSPLTSNTQSIVYYQPIKLTMDGNQSDWQGYEQYYSINPNNSISQNMEMLSVNVANDAHYLYIKIENNAAVYNGSDFISNYIYVDNIVSNNNTGINEPAISGFKSNFRFRIGGTGGISEKEAHYYNDNSSQWVSFDGNYQAAVSGNVIEYRLPLAAIGGAAFNSYINLVAKAEMYSPLRDKTTAVLSYLVKSPPQPNAQLLTGLLNNNNSPSIGSGENNVFLCSFGITNNTGSALTLNSFTLKFNPQLGNEFRDIKLLKDVNRNGVYDNGDTTIIVRDQKIDYGSCTIELYLPVTASSKYLVLADMAPDAASDVTVNFDQNDFIFEDSSGRWLIPTAGQVDVNQLDVVFGRRALLSVEKLPSRNYSFQGAKGVVDRFRLLTDVTANVTQLTLTKLGSISDAAVGTVNLYIDYNRNGQVDGGDALIAYTNALSSGKANFNLNQQLNGSVQFLVEVVLNTQAVGTLGFSLPDEHSITANTVANSLPALYRPLSLEPMAVFYGTPALLNQSGQDVTKAVSEFEKYQLIILGDGLQNPAHPYYAKTQQIINGLRAVNPQIKIFGYVDAGNGSGSLLPTATVEQNIDEWQTLQVQGIFLDEFGYDYACYRTRQNTLVDYVHSKQLIAFVNGWNVDDVFGMKQGETASPSITEGDIYLAESFMISNDGAAYLDGNDNLVTKFDPLMDYIRGTGVEVAATALGDNDLAHVEYAMRAALLYNVKYFQYTDSNYGAANDTLVYYTTLGDKVGYALVSDNITHSSGDNIHDIRTNQGLLQINANNKQTVYADLPDVTLLNLGTVNITSLGAELSITNRTSIVTAPGVYKEGGSSDLVPGSKIKYTIGIHNSSLNTSEESTVNDIIPPHTHLYYNDEPILTGNVTNVVYLGPTQNVASGKEVKFQFDMAPSSNAQLIYTVTVD